jgi:hypothetical protein
MILKNAIHIFSKSYDFEKSYNFWILEFYKFLQISKILKKILKNLKIINIHKCAKYV